MSKGLIINLDNNTKEIIEAEEVESTILEKITHNKIRSRREIECFRIINRGILWYDNLTETQKTELNNWYIAWLNATATLEVPVKPSWLD